MSYNVAIVNFRLPDDFSAACDIVAPLTEVSAEVEPVFAELHRLATAIYPCICDLPDDAVDDGVWSDGPLINNFRSKAPVIGFTYSKVADALPAVGAIALELGLSILDWQAQRVYNP